MSFIRQIAAGTIVAGGLVIGGAAHATPVTFDITAAGFTVGSGYGIDANESSGTLLDVRFSTSIFATQNFTLNAAGDSFSFDFGTVNLQEANANGGIDANETDNLGVQALLTFINPLGTSETLAATGAATAGSVSDAAVDYTLIWSPVVLNFGLGGVFGIELNSLSFSGMGAQTLRATVTLRQPSAELPGDVSEIPEPATLALFGAGLAGLGWLSRRRRSASLR